MLVGAVVGDKVEDDFHAGGVGGRDQAGEVGIRAKVILYVEEVTRFVAVIVVDFTGGSVVDRADLGDGVFVDGGEPEGVDANTLQVIQAGLRPGQVTAVPLERIV